MWALENMQTPPLTKELFLCTKLLKADPRNFHCWDYRRWLALDMAHGNKDKMELDFSLEKLYENFSNYSAWHYRTLFLPRLYLDENAPCSITRTQHKKELDLVQNAAFTDPGDQSGWFYLRWLLGKENSSHNIRMRMCVVQCCGSKVSASLALNMARECDEQSVLRAELRVGQQLMKGKWKCSGDLKVSHIWTFTADADNEDIITALGRRGEVEASIALSTHGENIGELYLKQMMAGEGDLVEWVGVEEELSDEKGLHSPILEDLLNLCTQLLDIEPDSRWALLTAVQLMKTLNKRHPESNLHSYDEQLTKYLDTLQAIDPLRSGFYSDLRSDCILESALHTDKVKSSIVDLSSLGLTALPSPLASLPLSLLLATVIDLSANSALTLPFVKPRALAALPHLPRLCHLRISASFPKLVSPSSLLSVLPHMPDLLILELVPDDLNDSAVIPKDVVDVLYKIMPSLKSLKPV